MIIKQLSVFIENRQGRLLKVTDILKQNDIDIKALSLADTSEFGLIRLIVSDNDKAKTVLKAEGFSVSLTDVLAVRTSYGVGFLHDVLAAIGDETSIEYMYTCPDDEGTLLILKVSNVEEIQRRLNDNYF